MIRVALVGLGKMGLSHQAILNVHPLLDLVAVCDVNRYVLDVLQRHCGVRTYTSHTELLATERLDALVVATPSRMHAAIVRDALERGLHVFCEKPFCLDVDEGRRLADLAESTARVNQVGYHNRFVAAFREARRLVAAGAIGRIHHVRVEAYGPVVLRGEGGTWRRRRTEGGGCLYDYACHAIDLVDYAVARPVSVSGTVLNSVFSSDVDDEVYATLRLDGGVTAQLAANWSDESLRKMTTRLSVWGTEGRLNVDRQEIQAYRRGSAHAASGTPAGWSIRYTTELTEPVDYYLRGEEYSAQIDHFARCIAEGRATTDSPFRGAAHTDEVVRWLVADAEGQRAPAPVDASTDPASGSARRPATGAMSGLRRLLGGT